MRFTKAPLEGLYIVELERIEDERGFFARAWCENEFGRLGLATKVAQANVGFSKCRGTLRGMHYQISPHEEVKLVRCTRGAVFDVAIDLRPSSPTYTRWFGLELNECNETMLYIPSGLAHGYQTLVDNSELYYQSSESFFPASARGVRFDDPLFSIQWPLEVQVISAKDRSWPAWKPDDGQN
jgi:dTDP-4-dehydrorhamnose 3,5-epimerase